MSIMLNFRRPIWAVRQNLKILTVTPWLIVSGGSGVVADVLTPLAPNAPVAFGILATLTVGLVLYVAMASTLDSVPERLETFGNATLIAALLSLGFAFIWIWQGVSGNTERGALVKAIPELQCLQDQVAGIREDVGAIRHSTDAIARQTRLSKKEVSDDPAKEIANMGLSWTADDFLKQIQIGNRRSINLFLEGGMSPKVKTDQSVMFYAIARKVPDFEWLLSKAIAYGFEPNAPLDFGSGILMGWPNADWKRPIFVAAMYDNDEALLALVRQGADTTALKRELISAIATIDEREAEKVRMKDLNYCAKKHINDDRDMVVDYAKTMCAFDQNSCLDTIYPERGYVYTATKMCEFLARNPQPSNYLPEGVVSEHNYNRFKRVLALLR